MKTIGFIDYYLNEWHANNYPKWIAESPAGKGGFAVSYAWGEKAAPDGVSTKAWCEKYGVTPCGSMEEVCEKSDYLIILSPDNSEKHLEYAQKVLPFGKRTYIDKTFTPALGEAKKIFALAEQYHTPVCSSSALRFAEEIVSYKGDVRGLVTLGSGPSFDTYAVHQFEIIARLMGVGAEKLMAVKNAANVSLLIQYKDGRNAAYNQFIGANVPFAVSIETGNSSDVCYRSIGSDFFKSFINALIEFFDTGKVLAEKEDTLSVIAMIEAGKKALKAPFEWIPIGAI
ncbi:hypothetical protein FACS189485_05830 [Spirochaetia bacterium]|nr:hypothetical protein FACS189485_05830 [Spirochaetia bacterium]